MSTSLSYTVDIDVSTNSKLLELAQSQGEAPETIITKAISEFIAFNSAFIQAVNEGLDYIQKEDAEFVDHHQVMANVKQRLETRLNVED